MRHVWKNDSEESTAGQNVGRVGVYERNVRSTQSFKRLQQNRRRFRYTGRV